MLRLPRLKSLLAAAALALAALPAFAADDEAPISFSDWKIERFRYDVDKSPKVVRAELKITNTGKAALTEVKSRMLYFTATGEKVKETQWLPAATLGPGEGKVFVYKESFVPAFEGYELEMTCKLDGKEQKWTWASPDPTELPQPKSTKPLSGVAKLVIIGRESTPETGTGYVKVFCRFKNVGEKAAEKVSLTAEFLDDKGKVLLTHDQPVSADGAVPGGKEMTLNFTIAKKVPAYHAMRVRLTMAQPSNEDSLSGGKFSDRKELEVAEISMKRTKPNEVVITAKIRNGLAKAVSDPTVVWSLTDKDKEVKRAAGPVPGKLAPGEVKTFTLTVAECPAFTGFGYEIEFQSAPAGDGAANNGGFSPTTNEVAEGQVGVARVEPSFDADGTLKLKATVTNRTANEVSTVNVVFKLLGGAEGQAVGQCAGGVDRLAAGASATFTAELAKPPKFATYTFNLTCATPLPPKK